MKDIEQIEIRVASNGYLIMKAKPMWEDPLQQGAPFNRPFVFNKLDDLYMWMVNNLVKPSEEFSPWGDARKVRPRYPGDVP